jgi:hypothetical protein
MATKKYHLVGQKFGRLTAIKESETKKYSYECICECGITKSVETSSLVKGYTKSCGCLRVQHISGIAKRHSLSSHPLYKVYKHMKDRCGNPKNKDYKNYGGRGITVSDHWLKRFKSFYDWALANNWQKGLQIDRRENNKGYSEENCRIVTSKVNNNNRRSNRYFLVDGKLCQVSELSERSGIKDTIIWDKIHSGWDAKRASTEPVKRYCLMRN